MRYETGYKNLIVVLLASLCLVGKVAPAQAQEFDQDGRWVNGFTEPWFIESDHYTKDEIGMVMTRWLRMGDGENEEWHGQYHTGGDTHGTYLRWSAEAGYIMLAINKCEARVMNVDYGKVEFSPGRLVRFISERAAKQTPTAAHDHSHAQLPQINKLLPVKWRGSRYLVREDALAEFCDHAAGLGKHNQGLAEQVMELDYSEFFGKSYMKRGDVAEELPIVPTGYERLVKSPVEASVTAVGAKRIKRETLHDGSFYYKAVRTLHLDAGSLKGIKRGMTLRAIESDEDSEVKITRVSKRSSTGVLVRNLDDNQNETYTDWKTEQTHELPEVRVGWQLTTSPRW